MAKKKHISEIIRLPDHPDFAPNAQPFSEFKKDLAAYEKKRRK